MLLGSLLTLCRGSLYGVFTAKQAVGSEPILGWIALTISAAYTVFMSVLFLPVNQLSGHAVVYVGTWTLILSGFVVLPSYRVVVRPLDRSEDRQRFVVLRWTTFALFWGGIIILVAYLLTETVGGRRLVGFDEDHSIIWAWHAIRFVVGYCGYFFLCSVVVADIALRCARFNHSAMNRASSNANDDGGVRTVEEIAKLYG
jgi:hypothetical protein